MHAVAPNADTHDVHDMEALGQKLKRRRIDLGLTQEELGKLSGVAQGTISRIEKGETKNPDSETARALAKSLKSTVEDLFGNAVFSADSKPPSTQASVPVFDQGGSESPLDAAIGHAFDKDRHSLRDVDALRAAFSDPTQLESIQSNLVEAVTLWLDVAARIRRQGGRVTAERLIVEMTRERLSELDEIFEANIQTKASALNLPPIEGPTVAQELGRRKRDE